MKNLEYREYYRRNLPHLQPRGATFLVNFRLAGSLPANVVERLKADGLEIEAKLAAQKDPKERLLLRDREQRKLFREWDDALDSTQTGSFWLKDERIADIVTNAMLYHDKAWFDVLTYCIMPNHVHLVLTPYKSSETADFSLAKIMHNIKRNSAKQANNILRRTGAFWQHENYDHFIRDDAELERIVNYVLYNPVKAGLVKEQADWKWSYYKYEM
jgi:REP element-mobilizing transposase RayT